MLLYLLLVIPAFIALWFLFLFLCGLFVNPNREYTQHSRFYRFLLDASTAMGFLLLRIRVHVSGEEKLPPGPLLFVGNHRSNYDPLVTWYAFRSRNIAFVSKPSNFRIPFFGPIIRKCCFLPIDRSNPRNAIVTIQKAAALLQQGQVSVGVYPEGTRSKTGTLLPFHNGVFKIAKRARVPIAVIGVLGTEQICKRTPWRRTDIWLDVLEVLPAHSVQRDKTDVIGAHVNCLLQENMRKKVSL